MTDAQPSSFTTVVWQARHLFAAIPLCGIGTGALYPIIALELDSLGHGESLIASVTSAYYLGTFIGAAIFGRAIQEWKHRTTFAVALALAAASVWALSLTTSPAVWIGLRFVNGFALGGYYLVMDSWIAALGTERTRGRMLASYEALRIAAVGTGPALLIIGAFETSLAIVGAAFVIAILPAMRAAFPPVGSAATYWRDSLGLFVCSPATLSLACICGLLTSSLYALGAVFAERMEFDTLEIAVFVSATLFAPMALQLPLGLAADHLGRSGVIAAAAAAGAAAALYLAMGTAHGVVPVIGIAALVAGLGQPLYALALGRLMDADETRSSISAATAGLFAYNAGTVIGPLGAAQAMAQVGPNGLFLWIGFALSLAVMSAAATGLLNQRRCCPL